MKKYFLQILVLFSGYVFSSHVMAIKYVDSTPLKDRVNISVQSCGVSKTTQVPLITWSGDEATILANGGGVKTSNGSIFGKQGLDLKLVREDVLSKQVESYLRCDSPYLRGTMGMINKAAEITDGDPRTSAVTIFQKTWSTGGDALVAKSGINSIRDLKGKTIALNLDGPHEAALAKVLSSAGMTLKDVNIVYTKHLVGFDDNTPTLAFYEDSSVDAAWVIIPDALALTSNGTVGTGGEDSVKGAKILFSTKSAQKIIADVYAVRADYLESNRDEVMHFVHGLMQAQERLIEIVANKDGVSSAAYKQIMTQSADILLDSSAKVADAMDMYYDATFVGFPGNVEFFGNPNNPRNFDSLNDEIQTAFLAAGIISKKVALTHAKWDYNLLKTGLKNTANVVVPKFDTAAVTAVITKKQQQGSLSEGELYSFEVYFKPNQNSFPASQYEVAFRKLIDLSSTYGGALITVEGHSDPLGYLKKIKQGETKLVLSRVRQSAKNLSLTRSNAARDSIIKFAKANGVILDSSQFAIVGHGFEEPTTGMCGVNPCAPKTEQEWKNNMRVVFRIIQVEAEAAVFSPI